jgi:hypothetical protein
MGRLVHASCGYSEFAPGCDEWDCLVHRLDVAFFKGWPIAELQARLDASLSAALDDVLASTPVPRPVDVTDRQSP